MTGTITALTIAGAITLNGQTPQNPPPVPQAQPQSPAVSDTQRSGNADQAITITGCLKQEKDVAGLKPSIAERAGVTDDYILTEVKTAPGSAVSGIGVAPMYEIEGISEAELKKHLGHQVELTGHVAQPAAGGTLTDAPDFNATSLKMLSAACPAAQ
jgi:hypothetical protein